MLKSWRGEGEASGPFVHFRISTVTLGHADVSSNKHQGFSRAQPLIEGIVTVGEWLGNQLVEGKPVHKCLLCKGSSRPGDLHACGQLCPMNPCQQTVFIILVGFTWRWTSPALAQPGLFLPRPGGIMGKTPPELLVLVPAA